MKGKESNILNGLNPYKLLSPRDRKMLIAVNETLNSDIVVEKEPQVIESLEVVSEPKIVSVIKAEANAAKNGLIKYFSFTGTTASPITTLPPTQYDIV